MGEREFIYERLDGESSDPVGLRVLLDRADQRVDAGHGRFTLTKDGETLVKDKKGHEVLDALGRALRGGKVGPTYRLRDGEGAVVFKCREVVPSPDVIDTNGNDKADRAWTEIVARFPQFHPRFAGAYVCKLIANSTLRSQHSYGNAVDIFFDSLEAQRVVFRFFVEHAEEFDIQHAISEDNIFTFGSGVGHYSGERHLHLHVDFRPSFSGGCGVRN